MLHYISSECVAVFVFRMSECPDLRSTQRSGRVTELSKWLPSQLSVQLDHPGHQWEHHQLHIHCIPVRGLLWLLFLWLHPGTQITRKKKQHWRKMQNSISSYTVVYIFIVGFNLEVSYFSYHIHITHYNKILVLCIFMYPVLWNKKGKWVEIQ